ncbi:GTPase IMAP family member 7-like [Engraulis encrasicolus]|uniref:GTPase IMAP family member 7-like n=1 Tax=Engraulis encrasicolus TaxID=184585 RepID=UPI002FCFC4F0
MSKTHSESLERRVVVLGANGAEKTFVISALRGQTEYEIAKSSVDCVRTTAEINGRTFTCVDTPGWWRNYSAVDTAEYIKRKLVLSVLECPPGPHVFLLVVRCEAPFGGQERRAFEQHLGLFGDNIWEHIIVVFTSGEGQKTKSIKEHIEGGGEALKWLVSKCGNRCHMLHSVQKGDKSAVTELLAGIDEVVAENNGSYFRCEDRILEYVEEKRKADKEKAASRVHMIGNMRKMNEKVVAYSAPELQLLLVGWLESGKTFARKTILGLKDIERKRTNQTSRKSEEINGRQISVVDTPGWYKYMPAQYLPNRVKAEIQRGLTQDSKNPHAVLLAIPVCTAFQEEQRKITEDNMKMMFGERVWRHTIVLFTAGDMLGDTNIEEHIETGAMRKILALWTC